MKSENLVYASEIEEFFWKDEDVSVPEGIPVGYEVENKDSIDLVLFEDIYWKCHEEVQ